MRLPDPAEWPVDDPAPEPSADLLRERARSTPRESAVVDAEEGRSWTYGEFDDRVSGRAERLGESGGVEGSRVGLLLGRRVAFAELYFAVGRRAGTTVALNVELPADRIRAQIERTALDVVVCGHSTEELAVDATPADLPVASVDEPTANGVSSLVPTETESTQPAERPLDTERVVVFTSGTSGEAKGARLTRRNLVASAVGSAYRLGVDPGDRWLVCLPMYHMGGLAPLVRSTLYGTTTVVQSEFDPAATARVVNEYGVTGVSLVPTMLTRLLDAGWTPGDSLRFVLLGGAPASRELLERCERRGVPAYPTYGMTETASQVATATPEEAREHPDTVGKPLRNASVTVVGEDGTALRAGNSGELVVDGPTVTPGYLDDERTAVAFDDAGFHTGDLGYADEEGRLWVVGRVDDAIVTGGENVHPARVADALREVGSVGDAAVVGLPDEEWGEQVAALVVPTGDPGDAAPLAERVRDGAREQLADFAVPKTVALTDALPRTHSGTVDRAAVRERLAVERAE